MKFVLFCEGQTERVALPAFLKRWLDANLDKPVGISPVRFQGWRDLYEEVKKKAYLRLKEDDVIAVISLLDLYGPTIYPANVCSYQERYDWGKQRIESLVDHDRFRHYFAVHEVEAWLLSDASIFPSGVSDALANAAKAPESVDFDEPPAKLLDRLYRKKTDQTYKKVVMGRQLFERLSPEVARKACPHLAQMLDDMLTLAKAAGN